MVLVVEQPTSHGRPGSWAEVTPLTALVAAMTSALGQRGPDLTARLAARAFDRAFGRWIEPLSQHTLTGLAREELQFSLVVAVAMQVGGRDA